MALSTCGAYGRLDEWVRSSIIVVFNECSMNGALPFLRFKIRSGRLRDNESYFDQ